MITIRVIRLIALITFLNERNRRIKRGKPGSKSYVIFKRWDTFIFYRSGPNAVKIVCQLSDDGDAVRILMLHKNHHLRERIKGPFTALKIIKLLRSIN